MYSLFSSYVIITLRNVEHLHLILCPLQIENLDYHCQVDNLVYPLGIIYFYFFKKYISSNHLYCKTEIYYDLNNIFFFRLQLPQDIALNEVIGKGKSGCVRKGLLNEEIIAVKIFLPQSKQSWTLEKDIYACCGMTEHDNILKFLGEAERKDNMGSEYWLGKNST